MNLRLISAAIALALSAMLLGTGAYESVVVAPNLPGAPSSLEHARGFYRATNPGTFFRVLSPGTQIVLLLALVCNWGPVPVTRWRLAGALALAIIGDVITFRFHYPRNTILFSDPLTRSAADLDRVPTEWAAGNYVRIGTGGHSNLFQCAPPSEVDYTGGVGGARRPAIPYSTEPAAVDTFWVKQHLSARSKPSRSQ